MKRRWFTILTLMILVAVVAVGLAAVRKPSLVWASLFFNLTLGLNFLAIVATIVGGGRTRAAGIGFAVCGWGYFALSRYFYPIILPAMLNPSPRCPPLLATVLAEIALWYFSPTDSSDETSQNIIWTLDSMTGIAAGLAGGLFAWFLSRRPTEPARPILPNMDQP